ncbi:MAG: hypothetical protein K5707_09445 [Clostridia bacterium]|nr:hypothetical protein [Clostridia bacterium]
MKTMETKKSNLDERQEQILLQIEHKGCWLAFWGLLAVMIIQVIKDGPADAHVAGEWVVFMILACYLGFACARNGIWDRRLKNEPKTSALVSLVAGLASGTVMFLMVFRRFPDKPVGSIAAGVFSAVVVFVICFLLLLAAGKEVKDRQAKLEQEPEDE